MGGLIKTQAVEYVMKWMDRRTGGCMDGWVSLWVGGWMNR